MSRAFLFFAITTALVLPASALSAQVQPPAVQSGGSCLDDHGFMRPDVVEPLVLRIVKGAYDPATGTVSATLMLWSCTDMSTPPTYVSLTPCGNGQQGTFHLMRTRHLSHGESLVAINYGHTLIWDSPGAPPYGSTPATLKLNFKLDQGRGGPSFCIDGAAAVQYTTATTTPIEQTWQLK